MNKNDKIMKNANWEAAFNNENRETYEFISFEAFEKQADELEKKEAKINYLENEIKLCDKVLNTKEPKRCNKGENYDGLNVSFDTVNRKRYNKKIQGALIYKNELLEELHFLTK